jgi:hypothetical protein
LIPDRNIPSTLTEFKSTFASGTNSHRANLFGKYFLYSINLKKTLEIEYLLQWIDGSYVTKEESPDDIDFINFLDYKVVEAFEEQLEDFKFPGSEIKFGVDAYIIKVYPIDHKCYPLYLGDQFYWKDHLSKTGRNRAGNRFPKGFLEISF